MPFSPDWASKSFTQGLDCDLNYRIGITTKVTNFCHDLLTHSERSITCWSAATQISIAITIGILRLLLPLYFFIKGSASSRIPLAWWASKAYYGLSSLHLGRCISTSTSSNADNCIIADCFFRLLSMVFISSLWLSVALSQLILTILYPSFNWAMFDFGCSRSHGLFEAPRNESYNEPVARRLKCFKPQAR